MSEASEPAQQIGTVFADPIRASSRNPAASTGRTEDCTRPDRQNVKSTLAMWEPSTEDIRSTSQMCQYATFMEGRSFLDEARHIQGLTRIGHGFLKRRTV
jgi:hypothetical protein